MRSWLLSAGLLVALQPFAALAQDPPAPQPEPPPQPKPVFPHDALGQDQGDDELQKLFGEVESRLRAVDRMLYDASAGRPLDKAEESGIDKLLTHSRDESQQVVDGIDRIIQIALQRAQEQQSQQQQGQGQGQEQGPSPLDTQRQGSPSEREQTPQGQSTPREGDQPQEGDVPKDGQEQKGTPDSRPGSKPPGSETDRAKPGDGNDRWGDLPVHVRELFRAQGGDDLPPRYRDWIDAYYRRLNERP